MYPSVVHFPEVKRQLKQEFSHGGMDDGRDENFGASSTDVEGYGCT